jgi:hypothetical protein
MSWATLASIASLLFGGGLEPPYSPTIPDEGVVLSRVELYSLEEQGDEPREEMLFTLTVRRNSRALSAGMAATSGQNPFAGNARPHWWQEW